VESALEAESLLRRREAALAEAVRLASEADTEARANFRQGLGDLLTVLATQQRAIQARSALATARRLRLDNRVALHLALGGDFEVRAK
jgi:outer membrane protein, multidrug efflux system